MNWTTQGEEIASIPPGCIGFIYIIRYTDGTYYYGKKKAISVTKKHYGKRKLAEMTDKRLKTYEYVVKESKWKDYEGSTKFSEGKTVKSKYIIKWAKTDRALTYYEAKLLFDRDALFDPLCLNQNILGRFYDNVLEKE